jgi:hypothetical protein
MVSMDAVNSTIISQYATSPTINRLISNFNEYIDPSADIDAFFDLIWSVNTAVGYGLDVWSRIVGVGRVLQVSSTPKFFGFNEASNVSADPFNTSPFYSGQQISQNFILADDGFRVLIFAKALANICDGSIPAINQILLTLFPGRGNCYIADGLNMTQTYTFLFHLTPVEAAIVSQSGILPRSTGVSSTMTAP